MKSISYLILLLTILPCFTIAQTQVEKMYSNTLGTNFIFRDMKECHNGDFVVGYDNSTSPPQAGILRMSSNGTVLWSKLLDIPNAIASCSFQMVEGSDSSLYLNGLYKDTLLNMSAFISKFDMNGNIIWSKGYPFGFSQSYRVNKMKLLANDDLLSVISIYNQVVVMKTDAWGNMIFGRKFVADTSGTGKMPSFDVLEQSNGEILCINKRGDDLSISKLNSSGQVMWHATHRVGNYIQAHSAIETANNEIFLAGFVNDTSQVPNIPIFLKIDPSNGSIIFVKRIAHNHIYHRSSTSTGLYEENSTIHMTFNAFDGILSERCFHVLLDASGNVTSSYETVGTLPLGEYQKALTTSLSETVLYGGIANPAIQVSSFIKTPSTLDSSCAVDAITATAIVYQDYSLTTHQIVDSIYNAETNPNLSNTNHTVVEGSLCSYVLGVSPFEKEAENVKLFPNPVSNVLYIDADAIIQDVTLIDVAGKAINDWTQTKYSIDVSNLASGIYFIKLGIGDSMVTEKFIKQ